MEGQLAHRPKKGLSPATRDWLANMNLIPRSPAKSQLPSQASVQSLKDIVVHIPSNCICYRPKKILVCKNCGFQLKGRITKKCSIHQNTIFLMDLDHCPGCHFPSSTITEYSDIESET